MKRARINRDARACVRFHNVAILGSASPSAERREIRREIVLQAQYVRSSRLNRIITRTCRSSSVTRVPRESEGFVIRGGSHPAYSPDKVDGRPAARRPRDQPHAPALSMTMATPSQRIPLPAWLHAWLHAAAFHATASAAATWPPPPLPDGSISSGSVPDGSDSVVATAAAESSERMEEEEAEAEVEVEAGAPASQ